MSNHLVLKDTSQAFHCPMCGSACVHVSSVVGGDASCDVCKWQGHNKQLLVSQSSPLTDDALELFMDDIQGVIRESSPKLCRTLVRWGFILPENIREELPIYGKYLGSAVSVALLNAYTELRKKAVQHD